MAITVENTGPVSRNDRFKVKCSKCGRELSYTRRDVRRHKRWPNGFIFCPVCKTPNGHREDNLVERAEHERKKEADKYNAEDLERELTSLKKTRKILFLITMPLLGVSLTGLGVLVLLPKMQIEATLAIIFSILFIASIVLLFVMSGYTRKIRNRILFLALKNNDNQPGENNG